jgi:hypothetical protein
MEKNLEIKKNMEENKWNMFDDVQKDFWRKKQGFQAVIMIGWNKKNLFDLQGKNYTCKKFDLKGQCHKIFDLWFFLPIDYP